MENIKYLGRALSAEFIKVKNTLGLWSAFIFPLFIVFMNFMVYMNRPQIMANPKSNLWYQYTNNSLVIWTLLFMPLFIGIMTFYINFNEHKNNVWRHLYSLPVPRWSIYFAKFITSAIIVALSMFFFYVINFISVKIVAGFHPEMTFYKYEITSILPLTFAKVLVASFGVIALQFVISIIFQNFLIPLGFSALATFASIFLLSWEKIVYYPYSYAFFAGRNLTENIPQFFTNTVLFSIAFTIPVLIAGYYIHRRMRVK